ncbi:HER097Wp [Eremothecium sinecaudum]|uniref:tRNA pseudouridine synthase 1 n=1 Tax=Eremothecium sinecaudum TaxID=45286 RepID=A0A109UZJ5_9SACH|nr:HER097Wp [Eremothecium sinecaudum]AMD21376.1 HER097Wp [Eremothecium sinecaudum]
MSSPNAIASYDDDQPSEDTYKRGAKYKQNKARKADYDTSKPKKKVHTEQGTSATIAVPAADNDKEPRQPKRKVAVMLGYCGTGYHGMQYNPPNATIEAELFDAFVRAGAISKANSSDLKKNGFMRAARTDKGVHAGGNVISLKLIIEDQDIKDKINEQLPPGIRIWGISRVNKAFDCRKLCSSRWYEYLLPTYSLIGPKPNSHLFRTIEESKIELPGVLDEDQESSEFWKAFQDAVDKAFTPQELEDINNYVPPSKEEFDENSSIYRKVKEYKQLENAHRRAYRISLAKLEKFRQSMQQYLGAHNFHNFTLGKDYKDPSAIRFIKEVTVSEPFVIGDMKTEWISIKIHGQSFMLHQIRKMISMATLITRCGCPVERISQAYGPPKINIPKAPALGLLLESPVYEGYNKKLQEFGYDPIDFTKYQKEIDAFKMVNIYDKIYSEEIQENVFNAFFCYIDAFNQVTGAQGDEDSNSNPSKVQRCIFDFLTARGIPTEVVEKKREITPTKSSENESAVTEVQIDSESKPEVSTEPTLSTKDSKIEPENSNEE